VLGDVGERLAVVLAEFGKPVGDGAVRFRIDVAEGQFLQFLAHVLHAHAAGQRRIDFHRFLGDAGALVRRHEIERAHVVQPVGELDEQDAHIIGDGEQKLAQVFGLGGALGDEIELLQLGQPLDETADIVAEHLLDLTACRRRVLDRVVQQADGDRAFVEAHVGQDGGDFERMGEIRVAGGALLVAMLLHGVDIRLVEKSFVDLGLVALNALDKLVLTHQRFSTLSMQSSTVTRAIACPLQTANQGRLHLR
jgi:hypothetical protein